MALQAITKAEAFEREATGMGGSAPAVVKSSQPLHNFSLPFLKWGKQNQMNNHRCRKLVDSSSRDSPSRDHRSSASEPESADEGGGGGGGGSPTEQETRSVRNPGGGPAGGGGGSRSAKNRFSFTNCSSGSGNCGVAKAGMKNLTAMESCVVGVEEARLNLMARFQKDQIGSKVESEAKKKPNVVLDEGDVGGGGGEGEELVQKPWNLRPRKSVAKASNEIGGACKNGELQEKTDNLPKSGRLRSFAEGQNVEKEKKRKLTIALTREEVDEDFFIMTGSKASRRPKKRAKNIQKLVDNVLPGLWLVGLTADSYSIPDVPAKK